MKPGSEVHAKSGPGRNLHLVPAEPSANATQQEEDTFIAGGVRAHQRLQDELDHELFGEQNPEKVCRLMQQKELIRSRLAAHGIRVRA